MTARRGWTIQAWSNASGCGRSFFFFQAEDGIRDVAVTGVQTCALPISPARAEEHEISARTEGGPPLLGEPRPHALLGLASALQVEDPAGVDRPPAVRRQDRKSVV